MIPNWKDNSSKMCNIEDRGTTNTGEGTTRPECNQTSEESYEQVRINHSKVIVSLYFFVYNIFN